jgi:hypothetical protein
MLKLCGGMFRASMLLKLYQFTRPVTSVKSETVRLQGSVPPQEALLAPNIDILRTMGAA